MLTNIKVLESPSRHGCNSKDNKVIRAFKSTQKEKNIKM
jgi:hypothetical protein